MTEQQILHLIVKSDTFKINSWFNTPIKLDQARYNYYLRVLSVEFSKVDANIYKPFKVDINGTTYDFLNIGIYDSSTIMDEFNTKFDGVANIQISTTTGRTVLTNLTTSDLIIGSSDTFFNSDMLNFGLTLPYTLSASTSITASKMFQIENYNHYILTTSIADTISYTQSDNNTLTSSNAILSFSSAINPFKFKRYVAMTPIDYAISADLLQNIDFEFLNGNGESITNIVGSTDFAIEFSVIKKIKF